MIFLLKIKKKNSFNNNKLYYFIKKLSIYFNLEISIFINYISSPINTVSIDNLYTHQVIKEYFRDINIKNTKIFYNRKKMNLSRDLTLKIVCTSKFSNKK
jgi:hypothetical protein